MASNRAMSGLAWFQALDLDPEMRQFLDQVRAVVTQMDGDLRIVYVNSTIKTVSGFEPEEVIGRHGHDLIHPDDLKVIIELRELGPADLSPHHLYRTRRKDGSWAWMETAFAEYLEMPDGSEHRITFAREVTDLVDAGARLRESEERHRMVVESSSEMITESNPDGLLLFGDGRVAECLGFTTDELQQMEGYSRIHPDDVDRVRETHRASTETRSARRIEPYRVQHRDGTWRWFLGRSFAYESHDGETRFLNVTRDITTEIEHERAQKEFAQRTEQAHRLESLGVMAGGIAHDFSNLLTPILGETNLALADLPKDSPARGRLLRIARAARRASDLTKQMLAYAGADSIEMEIIELSALMAEVPKLVESLVPPGTQLEYELEQELAQVEASPAQLLQVAMNLVVNAAESFAEAPGRIMLRTGWMDLRDGAPHSFSYGALEAGRYVYLEVEDDGCGMDAATRDRIFDPFFTTKFTGRGLGLAAVLGIVRAHGGALDLESEVDRGTRFRVLLPVSLSLQAGKPDRETEAESAARLRGAVLVVDDDEAVVEICAETLRREGLEVFCCTEAERAVALLREHADAVRLIVLDRSMPGASGDALLRRLREVKADASVLLVSGYSESRIATEFGPGELDGFLQKPFLPQGLVEKVRNLIG